WFALEHALADRLPVPQVHQGAGEDDDGDEAQTTGAGTTGTAEEVIREAIRLGRPAGRPSCAKPSARATRHPAVVHCAFPCEAQRRTNPEFVQRFDAFYDVCRQSINPNLSVEAVETMLIQHLMTERIFRRIFDNPDFTRRNVIAVEIEKVIDSMTAKQSSRNEFLKGLDHFYRAIELAAESTQDYTEKQQFMNSVY